MKVYVMTKAKLFQDEVYIGVEKSLKDAEKSLRVDYPHMRPSSRDEVCKMRSYVSDSSNQLLLFIHEEEV